MQYRVNPKNGDSISQLGYGCMRFPRKGGLIDQEKTTALIAAAIEGGINYFDTAYIYPGSEEALGRALATLGKRNEVFIATKLPAYMCKKREDFDRFFLRELERLQTDTIDYYLLHMLGNPESFTRLEEMGIREWISEKKAAGQIRNLGFSFHGSRTAFEALLTLYPWDFTMIQFNYLDENNQAGYSGLQKAAAMGLPVFVMEPLRGGLLATQLPREAIAAFGTVDPERTPAQWGLSWVWNHEEVTMALSGMSHVEQLTENLATAGAVRPRWIGDREAEAYGQAVAALNRVIKVPCTGCGYCMPCPAGVDIPGCFTAYNESYSRPYGTALWKYYQVTGAFSGRRTDGAKCLRCGACEGKCPQKLPIMDQLRHTSNRMLTPVLRPFIALARWVLKLDAPKKK